LAETRNSVKMAKINRISRIWQWLENASRILNPFPPEDELTDISTQPGVSVGQALATDWEMLGWDLRRAIDRVGITEAPRKD
jgi:hypothetical protein